MDRFRRNSKPKEFFMKTISWRRYLGLVVIIVLAVFFLGGCATMEEKRDKFMAKGKEAFAKGDYVAAKLHFRNAIQIDPKMAEAYLWLGKADLRTENPRGAFGNLSKAVELNPDLLEAQIILAQIYLAAKRPEEAQEKIKLVLDKDPKNTEALLVAASLAAAQKKPEEALKTLAEVRSLDPGKVPAYLMTALILSQQKDLQGAEAVLQEGINRNPQATDLYIARARLAESQKDFETAEGILQQAQTAAPDEDKLQDEFVRLYGLSSQWGKVEQNLRQRLVKNPAKEENAIKLAQFLTSRGQSVEAEKVLQEFTQKNPDNVKARFALVDFYLANNKVGRSDKILQDIIAKNPTGPTLLQAKNKLASIRLAQGHREEAGKLADEVLKENPKDINALRIKGIVALAAKDGQTAVNNFRVLSQDQPQNAEPLLLLARAHLLNKEPELAKENVKKAIALKPDFMEARRFLYELYLQNKDLDGAIQTVKEYLRLNDKDLVNWSYLGDFYVMKGDNKQARAAFQKMIEVDSKNPLGYFKQALLSKKLNQSAEAVKYLETALKQQPNFLEGLQLLVAIYQEQKQPDKGLQVVRQLLARSPKNPYLYQALGELLLIRNQPQEALAAIQESLNLNPGRPQALNLLILAISRQPDKAEAIQRLAEKAADSRSPLYYSLALAMIYEQGKEIDKAIAIYEDLLQRGFLAIKVLARNNLAYLLAEHQPTPENLDKAYNLASENLEDNPEDPRLLDTMGWILCKQNNFARGKVFLEKALEKAPDQPTLRYHLGYCAARLGETAEARESLEKALAAKGSFPERTEAEKLLGSLPAAAKQ